MLPPGDLRERGTALWAEVTESVELDPAGLILLGEACRAVDRLDRLSSALNGQGRDWLKLADEVEVVNRRVGGVNVTVKVVVDGLLSEARQQQLALKTILSQLSLGRSSEKVSGEKTALQRWLEERSGVG